MRKSVGFFVGNHVFFCSQSQNRHLKSFWSSQAGLYEKWVLPSSLLFSPPFCSSWQNLWNMGKTGGSIRRTASSWPHFKEHLHFGGIKEGSKCLVMDLWHQHLPSPERQVAAAHPPDWGDPKDISVGAYWKTPWRTFFLAWFVWINFSPFLSRRKDLYLLWSLALIPFSGSHLGPHFSQWHQRIIG